MTKNKDLGYFNGPESAAEILRKIVRTADGVLKERKGYSHIYVMDVGGACITADLIHEVGAMGGMSCPYRVYIKPEVLGLPPRRSIVEDSPRTAYSVEEAITLLIETWPADAEAEDEARVHKRVLNYFASFGTE